MHVHHLDCGPLRPPARRLVNGSGGLFERARLTCNCLALELADRTVLVDTGIGEADLADPVGRLGAQFVAVNRPLLAPGSTARAQVAALGLPQVTDIVLTHLDCDHAGGLGDFPDATVHVGAEHLARALARPPHGAAARLRTAQWAHGPRWRPVHLGPDDWFGFAAAPAVDGVEDVLLVALDGHLDGHCGVAIRRPGPGRAGRGRWLLHVGDAVFHHATLEGRPAPLGTALFERRMRESPAAWRATRARLRSLAQQLGDDLVVVTGHDPVTLERARAADRRGADAVALA